MRIPTHGNVSITVALGSMSGGRTGGACAVWLSKARKAYVSQRVLRQADFVVCLLRAYRVPSVHAPFLINVLPKERRHQHATSSGKEGWKVRSISRTTTEEGGAKKPASLHQNVERYTVTNPSLGHLLRFAVLVFDVVHIYRVRGKEDCRIQEDRR